MGFSLEYGVHISKQNANKIYKLLWTHSFEMVLFLPFFSLSPHNDCIIFLSFADHRRVRLCLFQNGLRHRITLYPPSRKVSFCVVSLFVFTCVCLLDLIHGHSILEPWALNWPAGEDGIQSEGSCPLTCRSVLWSKM